MNRTDVDASAIVDGTMARDRNHRTPPHTGPASRYRGQIVRSGAGADPVARQLEGPRLEITPTPGVLTDPRSIVDAAQQAER